MKKSLLKVDRNVSKNPEIFRKIEKIEFFQNFENQRKIKEKIEKSKFFDFSIFWKFSGFFENFRSTFKSDFFIFTSRSN